MDNISLRDSLIRKFRAHWSVWLCAVLFLSDSTMLVNYLSLLLAFVLHEWGHGVMAVLGGYRVKRITIYPLGAQIAFEQEIDDPEWGMKIAMTGPLFNLSLGAVPTFTIALIFSVLMGHPTLELGWAVSFFQVNLFLGLANLLPILPLDGGRILRYHLLGRGHSRLLADQTTARVGVAVAGLASVGAFYAGGLLAGLFMLGLGLFNLLKDKNV